jgi:hypothetical protein
VWEFITSKEAIELVGDCETPEEACRVVSAAAGKEKGGMSALGKAMAAASRRWLACRN